MKNSIKWILLGLLLTAVIVVSAFLYPKLSEKIGLNPLEGQETESTEDPSSYAAPDFTVTDQQGNAVKLSDFKGKPIVLNFWATWCYYCKEEMPDFQEVYESAPGVQFLMVNATDGVQETKEKAEKYLKEEGFTFPVFFDTTREAVKNYYVTGFPSTYFIDAQGNLVTYANGMLSKENLEKGISMILPKEE